MDDSTGQHGDAGPTGGLDVALGEKLAAGRDADVFALGEGRVLRRYRNDRSSEREAEIMRHARAHGYPVPAVYDVRGIDMVMERVAGSTMLQDLAQRPWMVWRHARTLARLHRRLAIIPPLPWMAPFPPPADGAAPAPDAPGAASGRGNLSEAPEALLHLDLHPDNVILSPRGPVAIDWSSAKRGPVSAAVALTWVIMATSEISDTGVRLRLVQAIRWLLVAAFLRYVDREAALCQLPAVARFRLNDRNIRPGEQAAIHALLRRHGLTP